MSEKNILSAITERRAYRSLDARPVPEESLQRILDAAVLAPSCSNNQPWRFLVMKEPDGLAKGREALSKGNYWAQKAPVLICIYTRKEDDCISSGGREYALFACGLAAANLMAQATAEGLVAHPMAGYNPDILKQSFGLPADGIAIVLIALGYHGDAGGLSERDKASENSPRSRKQLGEVVKFA